LDVLRQRRGAEQFRQRSAGDAPVGIHLEESVARMQPALHKEQVGFTQRADMHDPVRVARHRHGPLQSG
jgi:hypothetical protein